MKNWIIKKLGGFTGEEYQSIQSSFFSAREFAKEELRNELRKVPISVRGDCPDLEGTMEWQKDFVNAMCKVIGVEKLW